MKTHLSSGSLILNLEICKPVELRFILRELLSLLYYEPKLLQRLKVTSELFLELKSQQRLMSAAHFMH